MCAGLVRKSRSVLSPRQVAMALLLLLLLVACTHVADAGGTFSVLRADRKVRSCCCVLQRRHFALGFGFLDAQLLLTDRGV